MTPYEDEPAEGAPVHEEHALEVTADPETTGMADGGSYELPPPVTAERTPGATATLTRGARIRKRAIHAIWLGAAVFILLVAGPVFRAAGDSITAGNVVGAMLARWHYIALGAPVLLLVIEWKRGRTALIVLLAAAAFFAATQTMLDLKIRQMRRQSVESISSLPEESPRRRLFGALHGISSTMLLLQAIAALGVVVIDDEW